MTNDDNWLLHDHSLYESLLAQCVEAAEVEDWKSVDKLFQDMLAHLKQHMAMEEEVLYPAYERAAHAPQGPTHALREEHDRIVRLVKDMARLIESRNSDYVLEGLIHLEKEMIKHHEKEEDIFLPMASQILSAERETVLQQLREFDISRASRKWDV